MWKRHLAALGIGIVVVLWCVMDGLLFVVAPQKSVIFALEKRVVYNGVLDRAVQYYQSYPQTTLAADERMLLSLLAKQDKRFQGFQVLGSVYGENPFQRLINPAYQVSGRLVMTRTDVSGIDPHQSRYTVNQPYAEFLEEPWDDRLLKALYCQELGYDHQDFDLLRTLERGDGGYGDTHFLLALLLLQRNHCYDQNQIARSQQRVIADIVRAARRDVVVSDLAAERIVFLFWAGSGSTVEKAWIDRLLVAQETTGGFRDPGLANADPHFTGLATLAIEYFIGDNDNITLFQ